MRTNIVIKKELMSDAMQLSGSKTKRETVERGLQTLIKLRKQEKIRGYRGKLNWVGDINTLRSDS